LDRRLGAGKAALDPLDKPGDQRGRDPQLPVGEQLDQQCGQQRIVGWGKHGNGRGGHPACQIGQPEGPLRGRTAPGHQHPAAAFGLPVQDMQQPRLGRGVASDSGQILDRKRNGQRGRRCRQRRGRQDDGAGIRCPDMRQMGLAGTQRTGQHHPTLRPVRRVKRAHRQRVRRRNEEGRTPHGRPGRQVEDKLPGHGAGPPPPR
jgi:hypothetical protein